MQEANLGKIILPREGNNQNLFERLAEYISTFDEEWIHKIKPASKESIEYYKKVIEFDKWNKEFPEEYQIFLDHMGEDDGGLLTKTMLIGDVSIKEITKLLDFYMNDDESKPFFQKNPYLTFFKGSICGEFSFDLSKEPPYPIIETEAGKYERLKSGSFEKLLFQHAFEYLENYIYSSQLSVADINYQNHLSKSNISDWMELVDNINKKYNCQKVWFCDEIRVISTNQECGFNIINDSPYGFCCDVLGINPKLVDELSKEFIEKFGMRVMEKNY